MIKRNSLATVALLLVLLITVIILGVAVFRQTSLDNSSREFAIFITPLILSADPNTTTTEDEAEAQETTAEAVDAEVAWKNYAHPQLLQQQSSGDRSKYLFIITRNLGVLEAIDSINGGSEVPVWPFSKASASANYSLQVEFEYGVAEVRIAMLYEQDKWQITSFQVLSEETSD